MTGRADTATQGIDAGQMTLAETRGIVLDWEDLNVSPDEIRVSYQFTSSRAEVVRTTAIFPLAPIDFSASLDYSVVRGDQRNLMGLEVSVDGASVTPEARARAYLGGNDITDLLRRHKIPVVPFAADPQRGWDTYFKVIEGLPDEARKELEDAGVLSLGDPVWTALLAFVWPVTLQPNRPVEITYRYTPVPATGLFTRDSLTDKEIVKRYCIDREFAAAVSGQLAPGDASAEQSSVVAQYVRYEFADAGRWSGPIGRFYLTVGKGRSKTLVSICSKAARRTGATTVRVERFDYTPKENLDVLFIRDLDTR